MFVPVELKVGEEAIAILPGIHKQFGIDHIKAIKGTVIELKKIGSDNSAKIKYQEITTALGGHMQNPKVRVLKIFDYRIAKFTFGGVWSNNPNFDLKRIEREEKVKIDPDFIDWF